MPLTFGGKPIPGTRAVTISPKATQEAIPELVPTSTDNDVLVFLHLVARSLEARRVLADTVRTLREIDVDALNDPALEDHPRRPAMLSMLEDRIEAERLATIRLMEDNAALSRQWNGISPQDKNRYALTTLVGEPDPDMGCIQSLWCTDRGLALLVPFPDNWAVPYPISYRVFDTSTGVKRYTVEEVINAEFAPF